VSHERVINHLEGNLDMSTENLEVDRVARPTVTLLMVLCGIVLSSAVATSAGAATTDAAVPSTTVRYNAGSLATDSGARAVYRRIVNAAENVCPQQSGSPFINAAIKECRDQAVARAVRAVNNPRLAALYATSTNRG
jgi:UrcA family protein